MNVPWRPSASGGALLLALAWSPSALALPTGPGAFCAVYPDAPVCAGGAPCTLCHTTPPARNPYGAEVSAALSPDLTRPLEPTAFAAALEPALRAVEASDADGDGSANLDEILAGTWPGDPESVPDTGGGDCTGAEDAPSPNPCAPDLVYTLRKLTLDVCGRSPTRAERADFAASDPEIFLADTLARCLDTEHWRGRDGVVWSLAHPKIKPIASIKSGEGAGDIPLADYLDDYSLFVYTQTDDRDARELLLAQYLVDRTDGATTEYTRVERGAFQDVTTRGFNVAQLVDTNRRAGMMTMRWFLMSNTMFTGLPRTTAAQAYRAYLGMDIAKLEGLNDVPGEPADYDAKGVKDPECAQCHATLDPLTYPFSRYSGIGGEQPGALPYSYLANRPTRFTHVDGPDMANTPEAGWLLGEPVANLMEWAEVAANSEAFARAIVLDYWRHFIGRDPVPTEQATFTDLVRRFRTT
ncbi:MAG: hypothetical protein AAFU79_02175, partial [Myxococcota bacterium]